MRRNLKAGFYFCILCLSLREHPSTLALLWNTTVIYYNTDTVAALWEVITIVLVLWCWDSNHNPLIRSTRWPLGHRLQTLSTFPQVISQWTPSLGPFSCKSVKWCWTKITALIRWFTQTAPETPAETHTTLLRLLPVWLITRIIRS